MRGMIKHNRYCGPYALSHVIGCSTGAAAEVVREVGKRKVIKGVYHYEIWSVLRRAGMIEADTGLIRKGDRPTLAAWLKGKRGRWIVAVTGHYIVVDGRKIYDNNHQGVPKKDWKGRRKRVWRAWKIK